MARRPYVGGEPTRGFRAFLGRDPSTLSPNWLRRLERGYERGYSRTQSEGRPRGGEPPAKVVRDFAGPGNFTNAQPLPRTDRQARTHIQITDYRTGKVYRMRKTQARQVVKTAVQRGDIDAGMVGSPLLRKLGMMPQGET